MNPDPIYSQRLAQLADFLDNLPDDRFYYGTWAGSNWSGTEDLSCGSTACALGWATTIPEFRELGLRMIKAGSAATIMLEGDMDSARSYWSKTLIACKKVFGLDNLEVEYLFTPDNAGEDLLLDEKHGARPRASASAKEVSNHIRKFLVNVT